jgi:long-chain acyl-CoA synthetase
MKASVEERGSVFITGATGFVGGEILARLLARDERQIVCLVRAVNTEDALRRGRATMAGMLGRRPTREEASRVRWVRGDVENECFGLPPGVHSALARRVEEIYHCAASTRFDLSLEAARRTNLDGVRAVVRFASEAARHGGLRRLHHISSAYAAGIFSGTAPAHDRIPKRRRFRNSYERSKADAERFLLENADVPVTIYRPSIIVGDSRTGRTTSWNVVYYPMKLMAAGVLRYAPAAPDGLLDCVPVDFVADAICALGARDDTAGRVLHLTAGRDALTCMQVVEHTYAGVARYRNEPMRIRTRVLGRVGWWLVSTAHRVLGSDATKRVLRSFAQYEPYTRISSVFDNTVEAALLAEAGVRLPQPSEYFANAVRYALETDFGRRDASTGAPVSASERGRGASPRGRSAGGAGRDRDSIGRGRSADGAGRDARTAVRASSAGLVGADAILQCRLAMS